MRLLTANFFQIDEQVLQGVAANRNQSFLVALSPNLEETVFAIYVINLKIDQFGYAQTGTVQHLQHGPVPRPLRRRKIDGVEERFDLVEAERIGKFTSELGRLKQRGGIPFQGTVKDKEAVKTLESGKNPGLTMGTHAQFVDVRQKLAEHFVRHLQRRHTLVFQFHELAQFRDVTKVTFHGIVGQRPLQ